MKTKAELKRIIKQIEAEHSHELAAIMEKAFREFLTAKDGRVDEEILSRMLNLNANRLYLALSEPMYTACGITLR